MIMSIVDFVFHHIFELFREYFLVHSICSFSTHFTDYEITSRYTDISSHTKNKNQNFEYTKNVPCAILRAFRFMANV